MRDISVGIMTIDRGVFDPPRENYLADTLRNMARAGVFASPRLAGQVAISDGGSSNGWPHRAVSESGVTSVAITDSPPERVPPCVNAAATLLAALEQASLAGGAQWILFLEDDLDFCADFLGSVGAWLDRHRHPDIPLYAFGAAYPQVSAVEGAWQYPVDKFYGTQCFAVRPPEASSLAEYWESQPRVRGAHAPGAYDLMIHDWFVMLGANASLLASAPSFVQHVGRRSVISGREGDRPVPYFGSWPGRDWSYVEAAQ